MARLTKSEIEKNLLAGKKIEWKDAAGKNASITLDAAKQRRLFEFLLGSKVRDIKAMPDSFISGLATAFTAVGDPAVIQAAAAASTGKTGPWKIHSIKTEGFGGVNAWKGAPFQLHLDGQSVLFEGPNGSGKSSLTAAIVWALSGERPRDQADAPSDEAKPVFGVNNNKLGDWPPVATYPNDALEILLPPAVSVELTFSNPSGSFAAIKRSFDGKKMDVVRDAQLHIPPILLEAGLLMPSRLPKLRFDTGRGKLTEAVQTLTGLDDLIELGIFIGNLCHKGRDYLSYKSADLKLAKAEFDNQIEAAKEALAKVSVTVADFKIADTDDDSGAMAAFGKGLSDKAGEMTKVVSDDLAVGLDLTNAPTQKALAQALQAAETDLALGLSALKKWDTFQTIAAALPEASRTAIAAKLAEAKAELASAIAYHEKAESDSRYRLKAANAQWHAEHGGGAIEDCPTCAHSLMDKPELKAELAALQSAGEAATRKLSVNMTTIMADLEKALPLNLRRFLSEGAPNTPRADLSAEFTATFVAADRYTQYLAKCGSLAKAALEKSPAAEMAAVEAEVEATPDTVGVLKRIAIVERLCSLAMWFETNSADWLTWWQQSAVTEAAEGGDVAVTDPESLTAHITRIGKSLGDAEPYRVGAEATRKAWKQGKDARKIEKELERRQEIADALAQLKNLGNLAESQARDAINDLSDRIGKIHSANYLSDTLKFQDAMLEKKAGLIVRGQLGADIRIDATLIANTSWIRGVLWAFMFALREEAVEQMGGDEFPILVLDDPQQTFDAIHRHRWAEHIAKLQKAAPTVQVVLSSYDDQFLALLGVDGVTGRHALIASAGAELGHIGVFEGDALDRQWKKVVTENTPKAAQDYMADVRKYVEGMLKLMLRGEDPSARTFVIGDSRQKLSEFHNAKREPWAQNIFDTLAKALGKGVKEIKFIETAHHSDGANMGMAEAADVEIYWRKTLRPALEKAFRIAREHRALHGGLSALHAMPPTVDLPDGRKTALAAVTLPLVGSAAALTDGKAADGCFNLQIDGKAKETFTLKAHAIYRLTTPTLEPVARPGDLLLVSEFQKPTAKSLVVARSEDRLLARRLEIAENHSDIAVLTANAINPRMIAPPVVAKLSTLTLQKVIGVIYDHGKSAFGKPSDVEVCDCGGDAHVKSAFTNMQGVVEVDGHSAEPHALDKQFLIIANALPVAEAIKKLEGQPVIAEDSTGARYFKRLRSAAAGFVILESLEIGGDFSPVVLAEKAGTGPHVQTIWPVLGVLFERPS